MQTAKYGYTYHRGTEYTEDHGEYRGELIRNIAFTSSNFYQFLPFKVKKTVNI